MVIAVQKHLTNIKIELEKRGYEVVDIESYNYPIDAIIYEGNSFQVSHVSRNNMPVMSSDERSNYGVLIINSFGKSIGQIEEMLRMRCYSHLF